MSEARHGCKISKMKADNGGEYISKEFKHFCEKKGIDILYTVLYNPQMNPVSERLNRTLQEKARTMLLASGIKWHFWNEAVMTANYLKNRSPTSVYGKQLNDKTPAESNIRIFGSTCYNHIPADRRKKLDAKSTKCIMLGYGISQKTYRLWDIDANKFLIGRHVIFDERSILNKASIIEIPDSEAAIEPIVDNEIENDDTLVNDMESGNEHFTDAENTSLDHSAHSDGTGDNRDTIHSTNRDCTGNRNENIHGTNENGIGNIEVRRSNRVRKPVDRYGEWEYEAHCALSAQGYVQNDPIPIAEAKQQPDWPQWKHAIDDEYASLIKNRTWSLCELPKGRKTISSKWVFKLKHKSNGEINKYKARLVARGFRQEKGFDYNETYSPTAKLTTLRVLLVLAVHFDYHVHQMDVKCAFLNGHLKEEIYMNQPEGFENGTSKVCKLRECGMSVFTNSW